MDTITVFGEVLFDCFPTGERVLGGAPFNVAWHLQAFGQAPRFVSRVGQDAPGVRIRASMREWRMRMDALQTDPNHPSGEVLVTFEAQEPRYEIVNEVAYDFIQAEQIADEPCNVLYHGTLALRNTVSARALERLMASRPDTVFMDVNLRDPWWRRERVAELLDQADWVKLNETEFALLNQGRTEQAFLAKHALQGLVVTRGGRGARAVVAQQPPIEVAPIEALAVVDTVGAGDAFASVLLLGLNLGWPIQKSLERAQDFASAIVGRRGATVNDPRFYQPFLDSWNLS